MPNVQRRCAEIHVLKLVEKTKESALSRMKIASDVIYRNSFAKKSVNKKIIITSLNALTGIRMVVIAIIQISVRAKNVQSMCIEKIGVTNVFLNVIKMLLLMEENAQITATITPSIVTRIFGLVRRSSKLERNAMIIIMRVRLINAQTLKIPVSHAFNHPTANTLIKNAKTTSVFTLKPK